MIEKFDLDYEIGYSYSQRTLYIDVPEYAKKKIERVIRETKFTRPYIKSISYDALFERVDEKSFTNDADLYMFQILPLCLDKIDFERYSVGDHR